MIDGLPCCIHEKESAMKCTVIVIGDCHDDIDENFYDEPVFDGDGTQIIKGDTVYTDAGIKRIVAKVGTEHCDGVEDWDGSPWVMFDDGSWINAKELSHKRYTIDAYGTRIFVGDYVLIIESEEKCFVSDMYKCAGGLALKLYKNGAFVGYLSPDRVIKEIDTIYHKPDSLEELRDDMKEYLANGCVIDKRVRLFEQRLTTLIGKSK